MAKILRFTLAALVAVTLSFTLAACGGGGGGGGNPVAPTVYQVSVTGPSEIPRGGLGCFQATISPVSPGSGINWSVRGGPIDAPPPILRPDGAEACVVAFPGNYTIEATASIPGGTVMPGSKNFVVMGG
jgi:hypothetical protein